MKRYIKSESLLDVSSWMENEDLQFTDDPLEAILITPDGQFISGYSKWTSDQDKYGRDIDHRVIESLIGESRYDKTFWTDVFTKTNFIMLVPENHEIMYLKSQVPTSDQKSAMKKLHGYTITKL